MQHEHLLQTVVWPTDRTAKLLVVKTDVDGLLLQGLGPVSKVSIWNHDASMYELEGWELRTATDGMQIIWQSPELWHCLTLTIQINQQ